MGWCWGHGGGEGRSIIHETDNGDGWLCGVRSRGHGSSKTDGGVVHLPCLTVRELRWPRESKYNAVEHQSGRPGYDPGGEGEKTRER